MSSWNPSKFNWRRVLSAPTFSPTLGAAWVIGVACGLVFGAHVGAGLIILGVLGAWIVLEWTRIVVKAATREWSRWRRYRAHG